MRAFLEIWSYIKRLFRWSDGREHLEVRALEDSPELHEKGVVYLIGDSGKYWFVEMACPCGCGEVIKLKLFGKSPVWAVYFDQVGRISLRPSVWRTKGCRSHFFVRDSQIYWVRSI